MKELTFKNQKIVPVMINGQPYLGVSQIATALQYKTAQRVIELYARHSDEFTPDMTFLTEVDTAGGKQQVRVFSLRGCHLIAMFAKTPVAKDFRRWVLDVLEQQSLPAPVPALDAKAIGGIVKKCAAKAVKDEIANVRPAPFQVATAYEKYAFEDTVKRLVRETLIDFFAPEDNAPHPSGMAFGNWAASAVHAVGAMRSEYAALNERVKQAKALLAAK